MKIMKKTVPAPGGGFTMIEMMAVLTILAILIALVVGVGEHIMDEARRKQTIATQEVVMQAIQAYYKNNGPPYPPEESDGTTDELMANLEGDRDAKVLLQGLDDDAYKGTTEDPTLRLWDAYGREMRYRDDEGLGGAPVLISPAKDGTWDTGSDDDDDIRSDGR